MDDDTISSLAGDGHRDTDAVQPALMDIDDRSPTQGYEAGSYEGRCKQSGVAGWLDVMLALATPPPSQPDPEVISSDGYGDEGVADMPDLKKARHDDVYT